MKHILIAVIHIIIPEGIVLQDIYQMEGGEINNSVGCVEQFTGNAIGQKCLADTCVSIKKKIAGLFIKMVNKIMAGI